MEVLNTIEDVIATATSTYEEHYGNLSPTAYFDEIKGRKQQMTQEGLDTVYDNCMYLLKKYSMTGQITGMRKLLFHIDTIEKERELIKQGIDTFVYYDDVAKYIREIAPEQKRAVKIIELERYEREIPDEIVDVISKVGKIFDNLYVVFTDYTGQIEKQIAREKREKDPILFGTFQDPSKSAIVDRFYYLGDWVDEYCD